MGSQVTEREKRQLSSDKPVLFGPGLFLLLYAVTYHKLMIIFLQKVICDFIRSKVT